MSSETITVTQGGNNFFNTPILQSFLVKTNLSINLNNFVDNVPIIQASCRSGTIVALKYKDTTKGKDDLFKTKNGFKNACHIIMCHTLDKRKKKWFMSRLLP